MSQNTTRTLLIILIMGVALFLRLRYLGEIEHNVDHAYTVWQAMSTLDRGTLPLAGQGTSVLFANPPLTGYLFIPAVALTRSPLGVYVFVIALNTLAVWFTYRAGRSLLGWRVGMIAAFLVAVNPWIIEYSRTSWVQSLLPFFVTAVFWLIVPVLNGTAKRPVKRTALGLVMAGLLAHTYLLAYFIVAPLIVLGVIYRRRIPVRGVLIGGAFFGALVILYGIGLIQQIDTVQARIDDFSTGESRLSSDAWDAAVRLVTGNEYALARGLDAPIQDWPTRHDLSRIAHYGLLVLLLVGVARAIYTFLIRFVYRAGTQDDSKRSSVSHTGEGGTLKETIKPQESPSPLVGEGYRVRGESLILLIWFVLPIVAMSYTSNPVHTFYQLMGIPAGAILAAWGIQTVLRPQTRIGAWAVIVVLIPFGVLMSVNSARYYQETDALPGVHRLFALPLDVGLTLGDQIRAQRPENALVYAEVEQWILNSFAGELFTVSWDTRAPAFNFVPHEGGLYVDIGDLPPLPHGAGEITRLALADDSQLLVAQIIPAEDYPLDPNRVEIPSQQGITLADWSLENVAGDDYLLTTVWRVDAIGDEVANRLFAPFAHLFNTAGERILITDSPPVPGPVWRVGDIHVHAMPFTAPETPFTVLVGQFDGGNNANVVFFPPDSEPTVAVPLDAP